MSYFNNCKTGINAQNQSTLNIKYPAAFFNTRNTAIYLSTNSVLQSESFSGVTGGWTGGGTGPRPSISIQNSRIGILNDGGRAIIDNSYMNDCNYFIVGNSSSYSSISNSFYHKTTPSLITNGFYLLQHSTGIFTDSSITGVPGITGVTAPGMTNVAFYVTQNSVLISNNASLSSQVSVDSGSDILIDTNGGHLFSKGDSNDFVGDGGGYEP